jgi:Ca-activated chloride channel family protein
VEKRFLPFVSPADHPRLRTCSVPLAVEPSSYELAWRYLERNEWPPADRDHNYIRTEEFLAAVDYNFPKPTHQDLGLIVAGGPSPIRREGYCLLQVGVQARQSENIKHDPVHFVLLIDTSTNMRWGSRVEIVRRALRNLPGIVGPQDRLSLVTFNQAAHVLVENLNRDSLAQFVAAADSLSAEGATNIVSGLVEAYSVARQTLGPGRPAVRVVLLTDGLLDLEPATAKKIEQQVAQAAGQNIPLDVIDVGQQKDADPQLSSLAQNGRGTAHRAISAGQIRSALREIVTGRSQLVAQAARLQVTFNPKSVLEYRLLGHESGDWGGLLPGPLEADFREGQSATALFEVRLAPNGPNDMASVELTWYTPDGKNTLAGKTAQKAHVTVDRKHFAASLTSAAPSLQEAAVVAYTVEVLRHSPFIFNSGARLNMPAALFRAVELSGQVDGRLRQLPSFDEFVTLIRQEMKAHPPVGNALRGVP